MGSESRSRRFSGRQQMPAARLEWPRGNLKFRAGTLRHRGESRGQDAYFFADLFLANLRVGGGRRDLGAWGLRYIAGQIDPLALTTDKQLTTEPSRMILGSMKMIL
jgi:hypothetical protein